jgi:lipoprotein-releasing system ATP-binding protein
VADPILRAEQLAKTYRSGESELTVFSGLDLDLRAGESVALVGESGVGKSTLLHLLGALDTPSSGEIYFEARPLSQLSENELADYRNRQVGYIWQNHHLLPEFTALENVVMPQLIAGFAKSDAEARGMQLLDALGVGPRATHRPAELSGGEQQRVAIARAAANRPRIVLADEPTGNLDPATSDLVFEALRTLIKEEGAAALIATHNHDLARRADRIVTIRDGRIEPLTL